MKLVKPSYEILTDLTNLQLSVIETAGRTCYQSESKGNPQGFIRGIINRGHESVIEHLSLTIRFIVDRGVSHELVRHRLCSVSQESTRYCNYKNNVTFILPPWVSLEYLPDSFYNEEYVQLIDNDATKTWFLSLLEAEKSYLNLLNYGWSPQKARSVLPNSLKTDIVVTANLREWRHILKLRAAGYAGKPHPQMEEIMIPLLKELQEKIPVIFDDIECNPDK